MALVPKRVKFRKTQRGSRKGFATRCITLAFGSFGLQSLDRCWLTNIQIEAARVALTRNMNRKGKLWIRIFPDKSVTARPPETRMGKGKCVCKSEKMSTTRFDTAKHAGTYDAVRTAQTTTVGLITIYGRF